MKSRLLVCLVTALVAILAFLPLVPAWATSFTTITPGRQERVLSELVTEANKHSAGTTDYSGAAATFTGTLTGAAANFSGTVSAAGAAVSGAATVGTYVTGTQVVAMAGCETNTISKSLVFFTGTGVSTNYFTAPTVAGWMVDVINLGSGSVLLLDTGTLKLTGGLTLGQYDAVTLISVDTSSWVQRGGLANN